MKITKQTAYLTLLVVISLARISAGIEYYGTDLGTLPGDNYSHASAISSTGEIVGDSMNTHTGVERAFVYAGGIMQSIVTLPGYTNSWGYGVNAAGQVVGEMQSTGGVDQAFLYSAGTTQGLGTLPGYADSEANAINDSGLVVGTAWNPTTGAGAGFVFSGGIMQSLAPMLGNPFFSSALAVSGNGQIVGDFQQTAGSSEHAFLYSGGVMHDLGTLGGLYSAAYGVNNAGVVVGGSSTSPSNSIFDAFLYDGSTMHDLGVGSNASGNGINDAGVAVGQGFGEFGFVYAGGTATPLWSMVVNAADVDPYGPTAINNAGQIVGEGYAGGGQHAFLLTPVPEPGTFALAAITAACLCVGCWRRRIA